MNPIRHVKSRLDLIWELPEGSTGVEIGTLHGDWAAEMLSTGRFQKLCLVDPFRFWPNCEYLLDPANVDQDEQDARYERLAERFRGDDRVEILRLTSAEAFARFEKERPHFTMGFIDGRHDEYFPLQDLCLWSEYCDCLFLHDYTDSKEAKRMRFTVKESCDLFVRKTRWKITAITEEEWPTARLDRPPNIP